MEQERIIRRLRRTQRRRKRWLRAVSILACLAVFLTTYALILPAVTMEADEFADCGMIRHVHSADCYDGGDCVCGVPAHTHTADCFPQEPEAPEYICGFSYEHTHTEDCTVEGVLVCSYAAHTHTAECLALPETTPAPMKAPAPVKAPVPLISAEPGEALRTFVEREAEANGWQITDGLAALEADGSLTPGAMRFVKYVTQEGSAQNVCFRLMKHIIPTGEENEFEVRLSVEPVFYHAWDDYLRLSGLMVSNSNNASEGSADDPTEYDAFFTADSSLSDVKSWLRQSGITVNSQSSLLVPWSRPLTRDVSDKPDAPIYIDRIVLRLDDGTGETREVRFPTGEGLVMGLPQGSRSSFTIYYCPYGSDKTVKLSSIEWDGRGAHNSGGRSSPGTLTLPAAAFRKLVKFNREDYEFLEPMAVADTVTEQLGSWFELLPGENGSTTPTVSGYGGTVSVNGDTVTWRLGSIENRPTVPEAYEAADASALSDGLYLKNAYVMTYRVRLKTEAAGFVSCGDVDAAPAQTYPVGEALLRYTECASCCSCTAAFPQPRVRGLLYDLRFRKVDGDTLEALPDVRFTLGGSADLDGDFDLHLPKDGGEAVSDADGLVSFTSLPYGRYTLVEAEPPEGYEKAGDRSLLLSYTENAEKLKLSENGRYCYSDSSDGEWLLPNFRERRFTLRILKKDPSGKLLPGAEFTLTGGETAETQLTGADGSAAFTSILKGATVYTLRETRAPQGYNTLPADLRFRRNDGGVEILPGGLDGKAFDPPEYDEAGGTVTLTLYDSPGAALPATGGSGIYPFVFIGAALIAASLTGGIIQARRKGRGNRMRRGGTPSK